MCCSYYADAFAAAREKKLYLYFDHNKAKIGIRMIRGSSGLQSGLEVTDKVGARPIGFLFARVRGALVGSAHPQEQANSITSLISGKTYLKYLEPHRSDLETTQKIR